MKRADPERDETRTTHNYFAHGGNYGGRAKRAAGVSRTARSAPQARNTGRYRCARCGICDRREADLPAYGQCGRRRRIVRRRGLRAAANVPASEAATIATLKDDFNALLSALKAAGLMENA